MKRTALTALAALLVMTSGSQAAETKSQPATQSVPGQQAPGGLSSQEIAKKRQEIQQKIQQEMQPQIQQQRQQQMQQMQGGVSSAVNAPLPAANLGAPRYQIAARMLGSSIAPNMLMQPYMPGPAMLRFGMPFNQVTGQRMPAPLPNPLGAKDWAAALPCPRCSAWVPGLTSCRQWEPVLALSRGSA